MKKIATFLNYPSAWESLLTEYFSEVEVHFLETKASSVAQANIVFVEPTLLNLSLIQKIRSERNINPKLRVFSLGIASGNYADVFDSVLPEACSLFDFTKKVSEKLPISDSVSLLIADDDPDILAMVSDYFEGRQQPHFEVMRATNGKEAWDFISKKRPQAMILDMKMPVMTGSELYQKLQRQGERIPTIIFFDAISAGDLDIVKKLGKPVVVEKGYRESSMPYLMALIKKLVYFAQ